MENKKSSIGDVPFIRIVVLNEEEEDDDDEDEEEEAENEEEIAGGLGAKLERERLMEELAEMEAAMATTSMMGMGTRKTMNSSNTSSGGGNGHHQIELLQEPMPQRIA